MPIRGETIGTAYIRILADGKGLAKSIEDDFDDLDADLYDHGEEGSKAWNEGFAAQQKKNKNVEKGLLRTLDRAFGKMDADADMFAPAFTNRLSQNIADGIRRSRPELENQAEDLAEGIRDAILSEWAETGDFNLNLRTRLKTELDKMRQDEDDFEREWRKGLERIDNDTAKHFLNIRKELNRTRTTLGGMSESLSKFRFEFERTVARRYVDRIEEIGNAFERAGDGVDRFAARIGKMTGKGSRNNFFNLFGSINQALVGLIGIVPKAVGVLGQLVTGQYSLAQVGKFALTAGANLAGLVIVFGLIVTVAGPIAALLSGIGGALVSLAASAAFAAAMVGGLAFALGTTILIGAGIAVLALANLDEKTKKAFGGVKEEWKALGDEAGEAIGGPLRRAFPIMEKALIGLRPLITKVSGALGDVALGWAKITEGRPFIKFRNTLERFLPDALRRLGTAFGNFGEGAMGIFRALAAPGGPVDRFLDWLVDITDKFSEWANSKQGQKEIKDFFDDASKSAESLWGFLTKVWDVTKKLFAEGKGTGDSLLDTMTTNLEDFATFLEENPDALKDWFANAEDVAKDIGDLAVAIGKIFDYLDSEQNRENLQTFADTIRALSSGDVNGPDPSKWESAAAAVGKFWDAINDPVLDPGSMSFAGSDQIADAIITTLQEAGQEIGTAWDAILDNKVGSRLRQHFSGLKWGDVFPDIKWGDVIPNIRWSDLIPKIRWSDLIPKLKWSQIIPDVKWSEFIPFNIKWSSLIPHLKWSWLIPDVKWSEFIPDIRWGDLIPDIKWSDIIPDINWDDFVPDINVHINWPDPPGWVKWAMDHVPGAARGGIFEGPALRVIGEAGPEAVVPLARPLSQVDPAVRELSAVAQGLAPPSIGTANGRGAAGTVIEAGAITVVSNASDPRAVAWETLNYITAAGY